MQGVAEAAGSSGGLSGRGWGGGGGLEAQVFTYKCASKQYTSGKPDEL